jgi:hypothetical protein
MLGVATTSFSVAPDPPRGLEGEKRVRFETSSNIFAMPQWVLLFTTMAPYRERANWQSPADAEAVIMSVVGWGDKRNAYSRGGTSMQWSPRQGESQPLSPGNLKDWQRRWKLTDSESVEGTIRFEGGDLLNRAATSPEKLTTADFRLRPDSVGYRAGPGGKDLGADIDLVGPGAAYERWKKTPDYQAWLKESGQLKK